MQVLANVSAAPASAVAPAAAASARSPAAATEGAPAALPFIGWTPPGEVSAFVEAAFVPTLLAIAAIVLLWIARENRRQRRGRRRRYRM